MSASEREPLALDRRFVIDMYRFLGRLLDEDDQEPGSPPPPGNTREQLPAHILAKVVPRVYLSTACEMAQACERAIVRYPDDEAELKYWANRLHHKRCRLNNKYSGTLCACLCGHDQETT